MNKLKLCNPKRLLTCYLIQLPCLFVTSNDECFVLQVVAALPYLDREFSPPLHRSFFIPFMWEEKNVFGMYKLLKRHKEQQQVSKHVNTQHFRLLILGPSTRPSCSLFPFVWFQLSCFRFSLLMCIFPAGFRVIDFCIFVFTTTD